MKSTPKTPSTTSKPVEEQIIAIMKDYSGMDFCGDKACMSWQACLEATKAIQSLIDKQVLEGKLYELDLLRENDLDTDLELDIPSYIDWRRDALQTNNKEKKQVEL